MRDPLYAEGATPVPVHLLSVIACADACRVTLDAIAREDARLLEVCSWCEDVCSTCADAADAAGPRWAAVGAAAAQCALYCSDFLKQAAAESARLRRVES